MSTLSGEGHLSSTDNTLREPQQELTVKAGKEDGSVITFQVAARLDTPVDVDYYKNGGILPTVLRKLAREA